MNNTITTKNGQQLARPLKVLVPLIQRDIKNAEHAGKMFYISAGAKLLEAQPQVKDEPWKEWVQRTLGVTYGHARLWMRWYEEEHPKEKGVRAHTFDTLEDFRRSIHSTRKQDHKRKFRNYHIPVDHVLRSISQKEMRDRAATAAEEHELERKLAFQLIKIGYGVLATKLHPDKGGSPESMRRLNKVVKSLRSLYSRAELAY